LRQNYAARLELLINHPLNKLAKALKFQACFRHQNYLRFHFQDVGFIAWLSNVKDLLNKYREMLIAGSGDSALLTFV
jgi:hypothetical protein